MFDYCFNDTFCMFDSNRILRIKNIRLKPIRKRGLRAKLGLIATKNFGENKQNSINDIKESVYYLEMQIKSLKLSKCDQIVLSSIYRRVYYNVSSNYKCPYLNTFAAGLFFVRCTHCLAAKSYKGKSDVLRFWPTDSF